MITSVPAATSEGGGAALDQVIGLSVAAAAVTAVLLWIGYQHRARRITLVEHLAIRPATASTVPVGSPADSVVHRDAHLCVVRVHLGCQPAHR